MASLNLNQVTLVGRLTADPERKQTTSGVPVCTFTLAVNRRYQPKNEDGTPTAAQQADFISCVAWRNQAEFLCKYFRKGSSVCITGEIHTRSWTDQNNQKRYATDVVADDVRFVDNKEESGAESTAQGSSVPPAIDAITAPTFEPLSDDGLPF